MTVPLTTSSRTVGQWDTVIGQRLARRARRERRGLPVVTGTTSYLLAFLPSHLLTFLPIYPPTILLFYLPTCLPSSHSDTAAQHGTGTHGGTWDPGHKVACSRLVQTSVHSARAPPSSVRRSASFLVVVLVSVTSPCTDTYALFLLSTTPLCARTLLVLSVLTRCSHA